MNRTIDKIADISHPSLDILKIYFENLELDLNNLPPAQNITLYKKDGLDKYQNNIVENLYKNFITNYTPNYIIDEIYNFIEYLKSIYNVDIIWFMLYPPKSHLSFHIDPESNRHLINIYHNERFFNYESTELKYDNADLYTQKMKENIDGIDSFNDFFLNYLPEHNTIKIIEPNAIYTFGLSIHSFFNGSNKLRVNFVFETEDGKNKEFNDYIKIL